METTVDIEKQPQRPPQKQPPPSSRAKKPLTKHSSGMGDQGDHAAFDGKELSEPEPESSEQEGFVESGLGLELQEESCEEEQDTDFENDDEIEPDHDNGSGGSGIRRTLDCMGQQKPQESAAPEPAPAPGSESMREFLEVDEDKPLAEIWRDRDRDHDRDTDAKRSRAEAPAPSAHGSASARKSEAAAAAASTAAPSAAAHSVEMEEGGKGAAAKRQKKNESESESRRCFGGGGHKVYSSPAELFALASPVPHCMISLNCNDHRFVSKWRSGISTDAWVGDMAKPSFSKSFEKQSQESWTNALKEVHSRVWRKWQLNRTNLPLTIEPQEPGEVPANVVDLLKGIIENLPEKRVYSR